MGTGFKYHIVTVAAIFSALAIGLILGSLFASPQLVVQQTRTIRQLQTTLDNDLKEKTGQLKRYQQFANYIVPLAIEGRLNGFRVAVIQTGDYPDTASRVRETLRDAGATVLSLTTVDRYWDRPDEELNRDLATARTDDPRLPADRAGLAHLLATLLAHGDSSTSSLIPALEKARMIVSDPSGDYSTAANSVVIVAGSRSEESTRLSNVDEPLIAALQKEKLTVLACEPENATASDMLAYQKLNIELPTVDNVDSDMGRCALVFAFQSSPTYYGVKSGEDLKMPEVKH